jgi:ParB family chromosome partitioning protein
MAAKKKARGLGRGLDALFGDVEVTPAAVKSKTKEADASDSAPSAEETVPEGDLRYIDINEIKPNAGQPRKNFDEARLEELAESIEQHGMIQPIVLRASGHGYEIVAGERRYRASILAGKSTVPAIVRRYDEQTLAEVALIENLQREDLNPIEAALAVKSLMHTYRLTQEEVATRIGKSRSAVANTLRLLSLTPSVIKLVRTGRLAQGHARALLPLPKDVQARFGKEAAEKNLSVREVERKVRDYFNPPAEIARKKKELRQMQITVELRDLVDRMQRVLGTKVSVIGSDKKGRFYVDYYTRDDLERIADLISLLEKNPAHK